MDFVVDLRKPTDVEIGLTGLRQLAQEIRTLLKTRKGSVPLDREFGVSWEIIDKPLPAVRQLVIAEVAWQIERYIPRVKFKSIEFPPVDKLQSIEGLMSLCVTVEIREEYLHEFSELN